VNGFVTFLHEVFEEFGPIQTRRMFGGYGVYFEGIMIDLVVQDCLYLKADDASREVFLALGSVPFEYHRNGKTIEMTNYLAPEEIFDDRAAAAVWARRARP